jgi:hypothetical protein
MSNTPEIRIFIVPFLHVKWQVVVVRGTAFSRPFAGADTCV